MTTNEGIRIRNTKNFVGGLVMIFLVLLFSPSCTEDPPKTQNTPASPQQQENPNNQRDQDAAADDKAIRDDIAKNNRDQKKYDDRRDRGQDAEGRPQP